MKTNYYFVLLPLFVFACFTFGYARLHKEAAPKQQEQDSHKAILGSWAMEKEPNNIITFLANGHAKITIDGVVEANYRYFISDSCDWSNTRNDEYLHFIDEEDAYEFCDVINGIDADNSGILSLMSDRGRLVIYHRLK